MSDALKGKVAIITGSARNIGRAIAHALANELGEYGININVVAPGHVDTTRGESAGKASTVTSERPMARKARPEEIAAMVCHLCLPAGRYVTGQTIHVNGGMLFAGA